MDEAYAVFDTLSLEGDLGLPAEPNPRSSALGNGTPVLLKVPHVADDAQPASSAPVPKRSRIDASGSDAHPHTWAARDVTASAAIEPLTTTAATTSATNLRFDEPASKNLAAASPANGVQTVHPDAYAETLLQLDAMIAPYARWIALAAVIAAIGLTLVLLRDQATAPIGDGPGATINQAQTVERLGVFADLGPLDPITPTTASPAADTHAPAPAASALADSTTAAGPASAPIASLRKPLAPAVRLTGEVGPLDSHGVPAVATRPQASDYPRTAGYPTTAGRTRR